ncbi:uncharacterized protein LOC141527305 [Cotesia typhae]|uniref:uncharacterized protein LOC141527305 n=1 Tax=Cotesia typhae TaxID=2053667 RepID=UPI003D6827A5
MLLCDDEPSPESSDEVFFFCEEQANNININNKCDDPKDSKDNNKIINNKSYSKSSSIDQSVTKADNQAVIINNKQKGRKNPNLFNRKRNNKKSPDNLQDFSKANYSHKNPEVDPDDNQNLSELSESISTSTTNLANALLTQNEATQTSHPVMVKIHVENCSQCPDNSVSLISQEVSPVAGKDNLCKVKKKTVAVQVNFNSIVNNSVADSHSLKLSKVRCCNKAPQRVQSLNWGNKCNDIGDNDINSWSGKNMKNQSTNAGSGVITGDNKVKLHDKSNSVDRASIKSKKFSNAVSPLKQFNRSSLTIGPDKITINQNLNCYNNIRPIPSYSNNLSKYSPCASRLAASSKILGNTSPTALSPESPLHGARPKSPRFGDSLSLSDSNSPKARLPQEKITLQASLSLNINQLKKPHSTPRSRSVGDSCVTSPTSEATTLRYSPTGTEILSLDEIARQKQQIKIQKHHHRANSVSLSAPDLKALHTDRLSMPIYIRKANLETKC